MLQTEGNGDNEQQALGLYKERKKNTDTNV